MPKDKPRDSKSCLACLSQDLTGLWGVPLLQVWYTISAKEHPLALNPGGLEVRDMWKDCCVWMGRGDLIGCERIQPGCGLVQEEHSRVGHQSNAYVGALALAACKQPPSFHHFSLHHKDL